MKEGAACCDGFVRNYFGRSRHRVLLIRGSAAPSVCFPIIYYINNVCAHARVHYLILPFALFRMSRFIDCEAIVPVVLACNSRCVTLEYSMVYAVLGVVVLMGMIATLAYSEMFTSGAGILKRPVS